VGIADIMTLSVTDIAYKSTASPDRAVALPAILIPRSVSWRCGRRWPQLPHAGPGRTDACRGWSAAHSPAALRQQPCTGRVLRAGEEPTIGLPRDNQILLRAGPNSGDRSSCPLVRWWTRRTLSAAQFNIIDIGPSVGKRGGTLVAQGGAANRCQTRFIGRWHLIHHCCLADLTFTAWWARLAQTLCASFQFLVWVFMTEVVSVFVLRFRTPLQLLYMVLLRCFQATNFSKYFR
jgi:hypothetical protein